jgi:uncharacterized protein YwgA
MKKIISALIGIFIVVGIIIYANGYRVTVKNMMFTKKFVVIVTNSKKLYFKTYGPYSNPLKALSK